jgi:hypothetical protein
MKRLAVFAVVLALFGAACDDDDNPNGPSDQPTTIVFTAVLSPANEVPPVGPPENTGTGNATMTFHLTRDTAGNISAATVDFLATFSGFPAGLVGTAAHIHENVAGQNGDIRINTGATLGSFTLPQGSGSLVANGVAVAPVDVVNRIIANPAGFYFNAHSQLNGGGFARGQLVRQP